MSRRIFVTGASGFVGEAVISELRGRGFLVNALVNRRALKTDDAGITSISGGLFDAGALELGMRGCDGVIHLVGIILEKPLAGITFERIHFQGTVAVVEAARRAGVRRYVQMSALGTSAEAESGYHRTKFLAEQYVRGSGLEWTIFRPSIIHGPGGEFMKMEARWARGKAAPFLFMPYFGGAGLLQPVFVGDVARAFVDALDKSGSVGEIYPLGGSERMSWAGLHHVSSEIIVGRRRMTAAIPAGFAKLLTHLAPAALLGFNRDQVIMSGQDNVCDMSKFVGDFGWTPVGFAQSLKGYATKL